MSLLDVREATLGFGGRKLFASVSFALQAGDFIRLQGGNGTGKSSFLKALAGRRSLDSGGVFLDERSVTLWPPWEREVRLPLVDQDPVLELDVPVIDNLVDSLAIDGHCFSWFFTSRRRARHLALEEPSNDACAFGLSALLHSPTRELSYGQRRLLTLLRGLRPLSHEGPRVLLLDEPLAGLSLDKLKAVLDALRKRLSMGWAIIVAEHNNAIQEIVPTRTLSFPVSQ